MIMLYDRIRMIEVDELVCYLVTRKFITVMRGISVEGF